ncbi:MAG: TatD family hydrolase [Bacilli bacterium]|nr:TatD family hydrolase [Bacilli bacterium]
MFVDTHCHFEKQYYDDFENVINNAKESGVNLLIACGCSKSANTEAIDVANTHENIFATIGYHPDQAFIVTDEELIKLEKQLSNKKVVGIGEIGLDYHYDGFDKSKQFELFEKQLQLAEKYNLPVVIHSRDAVQDTIDILKKYHVKGVIHSFSGSYEVAKIYLDMGFKLGINGVVTFKNCNLKDTLIKLSPTDIVLETDSPYMTPHPYRGEKNESKNIVIIAKFLTNLFNISMEELAEITRKNVSNIFDI